MKYKATPKGRDLRTYSLDSIDVFLLSRLEDELTPEELADISMCDVEETAQRMRTLASYGLVEMTGSGPMAPVIATPANDNAVSSLTALTLPPPQDYSAVNLFIEGAPETGDSEVHLDSRNTLPFVRAIRSK